LSSLKDKGMQCRLLAESDLSLQKAFDLVQGMEAAAKNAKEIRIDSNATPVVEAANLITNTRSRKLPCNRCLGVGHDPTFCQFKNAKCNNCHRFGHIARTCHNQKPLRQDQDFSDRNPYRSKQRSSGNVRQVRKQSSEEFEQTSEVADIVHIYTVGKGLPSSYKVIMEINNQPLEMELDTGVTVSIISESTWKQKLLEPPLQPCPFVLKGYPNNKLNILGMCDVEITAGDTTKQLPLVVCSGNGLSLLGRNWLQEVS